VLGRVGVVAKTAHLAIGVERPEVDLFVSQVTTWRRVVLDDEADGDLVAAPIMLSTSNPWRVRVATPAKNSPSRRGADLDRVNRRAMLEKVPRGLSSAGADFEDTGVRQWQQRKESNEHRTGYPGLARW
jgi:hypothetical protein